MTNNLFHITNLNKYESSWVACSVPDKQNFSQCNVSTTLGDIRGEFLIQEHIFGESRPNNGPHRVAPFVWAACSPRDNKRARRSQLHLSKHLTRAIHKQSCTLTHFLPRNVFFYPLGLRGIACLACRVPLFVSGNSCILPQVQLKEDTLQKKWPFRLTCDESLFPR